MLIKVSMFFLCMFSNMHALSEYQKSFKRDVEEIVEVYVDTFFKEKKQNYSEQDKKWFKNNVLKPEMTLFCAALHNKNVKNWHVWAFSRYRACADLRLHIVEHGVKNIDTILKADPIWDNVPQKFIEVLKKQKPSSFGNNSESKRHLTLIKDINGFCKEKMKSFSKELWKDRDYLKKVKETII